MSAQDYGGGGGGGGQSPSSSASSASAINFGGGGDGGFTPLGLVVIGALAILALLGFALVVRK